jgi:hypothetical protein
MFVPRSLSYRAANPFRSFSGPFHYPDGDGGGTGATGATGPTGPAAPGAAGATGATGSADPLDGLTAEQRNAINSQIAAARREAEQKGKTTAEAAIEAAKKKATDDAEQTRLIAAGEFDKVKLKLEGDLATTSGEKEALAAQVAKAEEVVKPLVEALRGELPKEAIDDEPKDLPALDALKWLQDRKTLLTKLGTLKAADPKLPKTPLPNGGGGEIKSTMTPGQILG